MKARDVKELSFDCPDCGDSFAIDVDGDDLGDEKIVDCPSCAVEVTCFKAGETWSEPKCPTLGSLSLMNDGEGCWHSDYDKLPIFEIIDVGQASLKHVESGSAWVGVMTFDPYWETKKRGYDTGIVVKSDKPGNLGAQEAADRLRVAAAEWASQLAKALA